MSDLEWSDEPPEEPGWYWVQYKIHPLNHKTICEVYESATGFRVRNHHAPKVDEMENRQWAGPIPEPTEPNE